MNIKEIVRIPLLAWLCHGVLQAYDGNASGVSDVYESIYGQVLPASEDTDLDGYSNYLESLFGSNPLDAQSPGGLGFVVEGERARMEIPNQVGLRYRLESSETLAPDSWNPFGDFIVSDGSAGIAEFDLSGTTADFFRIELAAPLNSDSDGLDDWEEAQLGTDPALSDTDNDLLDDDVETMLAGSDPHKVDSDGDGFVDKDEYESGSDPMDGAAWPSEIINHALSQPVMIRNQAGPAQWYGVGWSQPVAVQNTSAPIDLYGVVWSSPVSVRNESAPTEYFGEVWSSPIVVQNDALSVAALSEIWSSPILVSNTYSEPAP